MLEFLVDTTRTVAAMIMGGPLARYARPALAGRNPRLLAPAAHEQRGEVLGTVCDRCVTATGTSSRGRRDRRVHRSVPGS